MIAALHDLDQVRAHFPKTLLLAREVVAWGTTEEVLTAKNLAKSRQLTEAWDEHAEICERGEAANRADLGMIHALIDPFVEFAFMRRALVGCFALSLGAPPVGVFLVLRRLSLMGDAMSHAILPGAAIGFLVAGLSVPAMSLGGFIAGIAVALARRSRHPLDHPARGREPRRLLSRLARARRADRLDEGQQHRPACTSCSARCSRLTIPR